jgi:predicted RNase H-like HicB family nuclease
MEEKISFTIVYEQDVHDGWYTASIKEVPGCHSQGFNLHSARENVIEAFSLFVEDFINAKKENTEEA